MPKIKVTQTTFPNPLDHSTLHLKFSYHNVPDNSDCGIAEPTFPGGILLTLKVNGTVANPSNNPIQTNGESLHGEIEFTNGDFPDCTGLEYTFTSNSTTYDVCHSSINKTPCS